MPPLYPIESLLSARLFLAPKQVDDRVYFLSDLSGRLSLYAMARKGSVPVPLLPPSIALQNPHIMDGSSFEVLPRLGRILVMIDRDGDENYQPCVIPIDGGLPEPLFGDRYLHQKLACSYCDAEAGFAVFQRDPRTEPLVHTLLVDLATGEITELGASQWGNAPLCATPSASRVLLHDSYTFGDSLLYLWEQGTGERRLLLGTPLEERPDDGSYRLLGISHAHFEGSGVLCTTAAFDDRYGLGYFELDAPSLDKVEVVRTLHAGQGELAGLHPLGGGRYRIEYNIDGASWIYAGRLEVGARRFVVDEVLAGSGQLADGVVEGLHYDKARQEHVASFSSARLPSQLFRISRRETHRPSGPVPTIACAAALTNERILGIPEEAIAPGEDYSFESHDGLRISARLYLPSPALGFHGPRPVVFYIHGGPQSQERPDFTWFSMPLIQHLTLNGVAVFVPNARGSTGYGLSFMKRVDRDWGGQDRLDHVTAVEHLRHDTRLDLDRLGVIGRSYGGYMTLTLAGRHPELWKAACDMFGPYDLFTFLERLPETWKTYFYEAMGHPERDRELLLERSPRTHLHALACPLLVIQGANDPRVVLQESNDLVEALRDQGKDVQYLVFDDEGHDVIKLGNKARCYNRITAFFLEHL